MTNVLLGKMKLSLPLYYVHQFMFIKEPLDLYYVQRNETADVNKILMC